MQVGVCVAVRALRCEPWHPDSNFTPARYTGCVIHAAGRVMFREWTRYLGIDCTRRQCLRRLLLIGCGWLMLGCQTSDSLPPIRTAEHVDLQRFMGDWYVLGNIPTPIERQAYNALESYSLNPDGTIATTFSFNKGALDGKKKLYHPKGFVRDRSTNAVWGMRFIWPFKAEYRILFVDDSYETCIIGRSKRDYLWVMARTPELPTDAYEVLIEMAEAEGYDRSLIRRVPHTTPTSP